MAKKNNEPTKKDFWQEILKTAQKKRCKIGIGINKVTPKIIASLQEAKKYADVVVVGQEIKGFECVKSKTIEPLLQLAKDSKLDAVIRGNFDALDAYNAVRKVLNIEGSIHEISFLKLNGVKMIDESVTGVISILPGSFVNDRTLYDKVISIDEHIEFYNKIGLTPKIGVLAPGKPIDVYDNVPEVNQGLAEADFLVNWYNNKGIWAKHFNHQIEYAVQEANIIVAQNSWAGNLAAHCLLYLGNVDYVGSMAPNIKDIVYVDDSEAMQDFTGCFIFASYLANIKK